jgi:hypothetical protein
MSENLKKDIEDTWGPYSQQAMAYKAVLRRLEISKSLLSNQSNEAPEEQSRPAPPPAASIGPSQVARLTATYFLTRGIIIISAWVVFLILFFGIGAGALWYVASEVESTRQIIQSR